MKVLLVNRKEGKKKLSVVFSWGYLIFGPFYLLIYNVFWRFLLLAIIYAFGIWKNLGSILVDLITKHTSISEKYVNFLEIPGKYYFISLGIVIGIHIVMSFITPKIVIKKLLKKKGYMPYSETDAQLLVKYSLVKVGTKCYLTNNKPINGIQGTIKINNSEELNKKLENLAELLKEGMISKDEYNKKRAEALMNLEEK